jgi:hypothetical protein
MSFAQRQEVTGLHTIITLEKRDYRQMAFLPIPVDDKTTFRDLACGEAVVRDV